MLTFVLGLQWLLILILAVAVAALAQQIGILHTRLGPAGARVIPDGPELGTSPQPATVPSVVGQVVEIAGAQSDQQILIVLSPDCAACRRLAPGLRRFALDHPTTHVVTIIVRASQDEALEFAHKFNLDPTTVVLGVNVPDGILPEGTPFAIRLDAGRATAKGIVNSYEHLSSVIASEPVQHPESRYKGADTRSSMHENGDGGARSLPSINR